MSSAFPLPAPSRFRGRIGRDARSGYYAAARRYRLHLALSCPDGLRIAVTHSLLGLGDTLPVTLLPAVPDAPGGGHRALRPLYEASSHAYAGPAVAPVLSDNWTGRIVSTHAPDILRDLVARFGGHGPDLRPHGVEEELEDVRRLCAEDIGEAAQRAGQADPRTDIGTGIGTGTSTGTDIGTGTGTDAAARRDAAPATLLRTLGVLERRLAFRRFMVGGHITLADVDLWVALVELDTVHRHHLDAVAVDRIADHPRLWAYARRLAAHPAFGAHLDLDGIARRHHAHCRGEEAAGAAVRIVDWDAHTGRQRPEAARRTG
ncbi:glutathione S-transferase C-terminal domain-containing protein [Streptomyces sp. NPDC005012]|uniref:glutathione S-transferase C-terminal domain-containing protein n=1 Tax=Streptomyces sp. NPDC005012 TaxID=3154558 RepID=UPI0033B6C8DD